MIERANELLSLLGNEVSLRWMLTLLHFLWQGAGCGVLRTSRRADRRRHPASRRVVACIGYDRPDAR